MEITVQIMFCVVIVTYCSALEESAYPENLLDISTECQRTCTLEDPNLDVCWDQSLKYYTERLAQAASGYAATLLYMPRWRQRHAGGEMFEQQALAAFMKEFNTSFHDEEAEGFRVQPETMQQIFQLLMNASASMYEEKYTDEAHLLPSFACPTPCSYDYTMWRVLFFVMLAVFVLSLLSFAAYLYSQRQHMNEWDGSRKLVVKAGQ